MRSRVQVANNLVRGIWATLGVIHVVGEFRIIGSRDPWSLRESMLTNEQPGFQHKEADDEGVDYAKPRAKGLSRFVGVGFRVEGSWD